MATSVCASSRRPWGWRAAGLPRSAPMPCPRRSGPDRFLTERDMTALKPRPGILQIAPYVPGKDSVDGKEPVVKLSSNESALGSSPMAMAAHNKMAADLHRYPDGTAEKLRAAIGKHYGLDPAHIVCGTGSD